MITEGAGYGRFQAGARLIFVICVVAGLLIGPLASGCRTQGPSELKVLCAGSLMVPFQEIEAAFEAQNPGVDVLIEGHGSIQVIRTVTELGEEADVVAVADHDLIPLLMYDTQMPDSARSYADWYVKFASNALGIAYTPKSRYAGEINKDNWYDILRRPGVKIGVADPRLDPCGYRSLMVCQLAEDYYGDDRIFDDIFGGFRPAIGLAIASGVTTMTVPEVLKPEADRVLLRGNSVWLIPMLEAGEADYAFEYESVAKQHGAQFLELPPEINLSLGDLAGSYGTVSCELSFQRFTSVNPEFRGQPIVYGVTVPENAPHRKLALDFVKFVIGAPGQEIMRRNFHPPLVPALADHPENLPGELGALVGQP